MDIFPSFILLIHVTFSNYLLSVFVYYIVTLYTLPMPIAGFHCHAIKIKIENHSMNEVKKFTRYRRYINKYSVQASGLCGIPYSSYLT